MEPELTRRGFLGAAAALALPAEYPFYRARGGHRQLGREHGEQAADDIGGQSVIPLPFAESAKGRCPRSGRRGHEHHHGCS